MKLNNNSNIDPLEIDKFNKLAEDWWNPNGDFAPLHQLNPLRFEYIKTNADLKDKVCIDIGCGGGILTESIASKANSVIGIDLASKALSVAKSHQILSLLSNIEYQEVSIEEHARKYQNYYNVLTCMEMLEHVPFPEKTIEACSSVVKKGGQLFFSTINRNPKSFLMAILGAEYILKLLPKGTHEYDCFIKPSELENWARKYNLYLDELIGVQYNPLTKSFSLTGDVSVNYMMKFTKL